MKRILSLLLTLCFSLGLCLPAFAEQAEDAALLYEAEELNATDVPTALGFTLPEGSADLLGWLQNVLGTLFDGELLGQKDASSLTEALLYALLGGGSGSANPGVVQPDTGDPVQPTIRDGVPYSVTKRRTYADKNGDREYTLLLTGYFINVNGTPRCLRAESDFTTEAAGRWRITPGAVKIDDDKAVCPFTVERLFTGVPVKTDVIHVTVTGKPSNTVIAGPVMGDLDGDASLTAADARLALRAAVGLQTLSADEKAKADVDCDGNVTAADARLILRAAVGL